ncbi:hypothetical protein C8F01DRAFT_537771 [Mycena amicta]|nr:hypothetical protein C8F01DRAFT_537771 [Mycena amicta]
MVSFEEKPPLPDLDVSAPSPLAKANPQTYLAIYVRICRILGDAIDKVYGHNARIREDPLSQQRQQQIVSELDSEMNDCFNSFPPHLCWDSEPSTRDQSSESFDKAFLLYVTFQYVRIVIHRPYIEISNILAAPSFSICVNAASSIIQAADTWLKARQRLPIQLVVVRCYLKNGLRLTLYASARCLWLVRP